MQATISNPSFMSPSSTLQKKMAQQRNPYDEKYVYLCYLKKNRWKLFPKFNFQKRSMDGSVTKFQLSKFKYNGTTKN